MYVQEKGVLFCFFIERKINATPSVTPNKCPPFIKPTKNISKNHLILKKCPDYIKFRRW